jgi:4-amino-4-deoxy-L-arabinose transferase-like glycosyltransferase
MPPADDDHRLTRSDSLWILAFCALIFGLSLVGGRVLSVHEARLPQTSREMMTSGDYLVPTSGGRPWMERPPLPHWISCAVSSAIGIDDQVWVFRLPSVIMATIATMLLAHVAAWLFGRGIGIFSALVLATQFEFLRYAWLAEEEAYLAAMVMTIMALFAWIEFGRRPSETEAKPAPSTWGERIRLELFSLIGPRSLAIVALFLALGISNWVKGLFFAAAVSLVPIGAYLLGTRDWTRIRRYIWLPGVAMFVGIAVIWPILAYLRYPDVLQIMGFDVRGRLDGTTFDDPWWYYLATVPWAIAPWPLLTAAGLAFIVPKAWRDPASPERFLFCWSVVTVAFLTVPSGKHHHYLVPVLAPWAILGAIGSYRMWLVALEWPNWIKNPAWGLMLGSVGAAVLWGFRDHIPGPAFVLPTAMAIIVASLTLMWYGMFLRDVRWAGGMLVGISCVVYSVGHVYTAHYYDSYRLDTEFLVRTHDALPDAPLYVDGSAEALEVFRKLFYLPEGTKLLHNLTFLLDETIHEREIYMVARHGALEEMRKYGTVEFIDQSEDGREHPGERWALWKLTFHPGLARYPNNVEISPTQAYRIAEGPVLGQPQLR